MDAISLIVACGGVAPASRLVAAGVSRRRLTRLVAEGELHRPRNGWYSTLAPLHPRFRAVRIGGRLTGASALFDMGAWMLRRPSALEVSVARGSARLRADPGAVIHWEVERERPDSLAVVSLRAALVRVVLDHDLEVAVPCVDWAFATGRLDRFDFELFILDLPASARSIRRWVDRESQSVMESVARVRLRRQGWRVRSQVRVGELEAIDLIVADQVAIELDGRKHHEAAFEADRRKDLQIAIEGRHSIRVTYSMLMNEWPRVEAAIANAVRARGVTHAQDSANTPPVPYGSRHARRIPTTSD